MDWDTACSRKPDMRAIVVPWEKISSSRIPARRLLAEGFLPGMLCLSCSNAKHRLGCGEIMIWDSLGTPKPQRNALQLDKFPSQDHKRSDDSRRRTGRPRRQPGPYYYRLVYIAQLLTHLYRAVFTILPKMARPVSHLSQVRSVGFLWS